MNVHHLAALLVRIAGLVLVLKSFETGIGMAMVGARDVFGQSNTWAFLTFHVMWLTAGILMLLFPARIAGNFMPSVSNEVKVDNDIPADALTRLILVAAGLYFVVDGILTLSYIATYWAVYTAQGVGRGLAPVPFWSGQLAGQTVAGVISVVAGLWLLLRPVGIANLIHRLRRSHPDKS